MKTLVTSTFWLLVSSSYLLAPLVILAQPTEAWVARYNGGFTTMSHAPLAVRLDVAGNIYVAGSSRNATNVSDYVVLKYAASGTPVYAKRYGSTNGTDYTAKAFALGQDGSALLTGTGGTVKFEGNGGIAWTATYAGKDVAVDSNGNVYVTGFSSVQYATVKLNALGSNVWVRLYANGDAAGEWRTESQKVAVDNAGNVYVAGCEAYGAPYRCNIGQTNLCRYSRPSLLMYDSTGVCVWTNAPPSGSWGEIKQLRVDNQGVAYYTRNGDLTFQTYKVNAGGQSAWTWVYGPQPGVCGMALADSGEILLTGSVNRQFSYDTSFVTFKLNTNGQTLWQTNYIGPTSDQSNGLALDSLGSVYVTGISTNSGTSNDFATIKYDTDGHQLWVKRYNGPANGNDGATGIAVAPDGSIYVTGYSANSSGGSDIVLIKYAMPTTIQKTTDGSMLLQGYGAPGTNYIFQAGTNLLNWDPIGSSIADTNGLFQFTDTNAPLFPSRFYRWTLP